MLGLKKRTFHGGAHPPEGKHYTEKKPIEKMPAPEQVVIPLQQHIGAPSEAIVKPGDLVKIGDPLSEPKGFVSVPVHASVSGKVLKVVPMPHPLGRKVLSVIIQNDGEDAMSDAVQPNDDYMSLSVADMRKKIQMAGIAGMGGATFPTHVKLSPPEEKPIDTLIINGVECEPYLTADHRLMLEHTDEILAGVKILQKILNVKSTYIAIEKNKPDAIKKMQEATKSDSTVEVVPLKVKYPQGAEKQLINAITGREVPTGGLPMDVGCLVQNVGTTRAIYEALAKGKPLYERVVSVTGPGIKEPKNLLVRLGTSFQSVIDYCGGYTEDVAKLIMGGPMMGLAQYSDEVPVIKGTSGILLLTEAFVRTSDPLPCIGCNRCVDTCPMHLVPTKLAEFADFKRYEEAEKWGIMDCIECGTCTFVCPAKRHLLQSIRFGKFEINQQKRKAS